MINNSGKLTEHKSSSARISLLKNLVNLLYDDLSYEIISYIINLNGKEAEEQKLADDLSISFTQVRQSLITMEKHGILLS
jgi:hypothetical protein